GVGVGADRQDLDVDRLIRPGVLVSGDAVDLGDVVAVAVRGRVQRVGGVPGAGRGARGGAAGGEVKEGVGGVAVVVQVAAGVAVDEALGGPVGQVADGAAFKGRHVIGVRRLESQEQVACGVDDGR